MQTNFKPKKVKYGKAERMSFAKIEEKLSAMPFLLEIQKEPYKQFLTQGIKEVLEEVSPIVNYSDKAELYFLEPKLEPNTKHTEDDCRKSRLSYTMPLKVKARLVLKEDSWVPPSIVCILFAKVSIESVMVSLYCKAISATDEPFSPET